jgi:hypothetical protein
MPAPVITLVIGTGVRERLSDAEAMIELAPMREIFPRKL